MSTVTLTIDGMEVEVPAGTSILQAAEELGIEIPRFCYHDKLSVPANCRMCLVEVEGGPPKPVASCAMACGGGMVVKTDTDIVKKARKGVMEMMLINHPLDCPICDQGGECDLQDQAVGFGFDRSRYHESKRAKTDEELGPLISTTMTRCINCTRCIRFAEEIAGTPVLGQFYRGEDAQIGTFIDRIVETELSGNLIDVCPVGALTSKPYAFKARPWELKSFDTIDVHDAVGANITVDLRGRAVMRVLPRLNEDINETWIDDRTRFAHDGLEKGRLDRPYIRDKESGKLLEANWDEALAFIKDNLEGLQGDEIAGLVGDLQELESIVALKDLLSALGSPHMDCRTEGSQIDPGNRAGYLFNSGIAGIEKADAILLIGTNPRLEAAMVNARLCKAQLHNQTPIALIGESADLTYTYEHLGDSPADLEKLMKARTGFAKILKEAKNPMIIVGAGAFAREDGEAIQALTLELAQKFGTVTEEWNGYNVLHKAASRVGALEVGFVPQAGGRGFAGILDGTKDGSIKALYLLGVDEFDARAEIGWQAFTIYQGHHGDHGAARADVVLPGAAYTEKEGLYVNMEGRPQSARRASSPPGDAREDWKILRALSETLELTLPYDIASQLYDRIFEEWPHLGELGDIKPALWAEIAKGKGGKCSGAPFAQSVKSFYLNNAIARASDTMRECATAFVGHDKAVDRNIVEAAE